LSHPVKIQDLVRTAILEAESKPSPDTETADVLILDFPASRTVSNKFMLFISWAIFSILLQQYTQPNSLCVRTPASASHQPCWPPGFALLFSQKALGWTPCSTTFQLWDKHTLPRASETTGPVAAAGITS
jgi:hypothetical protein